MYRRIINNGFLYTGALVAFLIPLSHRITVYAIALFFLFWLFSGEWISSFKTSLRRPVFIIGLSFFLIHLIGLIYTSNKSSGWFDIEVKLSLLFFLLIFGLSGSLLKEKAKYLLYAFAGGTFVAIVACFGIAFYNYYARGLNTFSYMEFSVFHHPTYFAMYICFSAAIILSCLYSDSKKTLVNYMIGIFLLILLATTVYMLSSKAGILAYFIVLILMSLPSLFNSRKRIFSSVVIAFAFFQIWFSWTQNNRFQSVQESVVNAEQNVQTEESNAVRVLVWETTFDLIKANMVMGVGTGDIKDELLNQYQNRNMIGAYENKLNVHNQFLETWLGQGIPGITLLLLLFIIPVVNAFRKRNWFLLTFVCLVGFNFLFESMFNTQAGVVFFAFFYYLFAFVPLTKYTEDHKILH